MSPEPKEPSDTAIILGRIEAAEKNTVERIATSDERVKEIFNAHETRDQERFQEQTTKLNDTRHQINGSLTTLTAEVQKVDGRIAAVEQKTEIIEDRANEIAKRKAYWLTWKQGVGAALAGGAGYYVLNAFHLV